MMRASVMQGLRTASLVSALMVAGGGLPLRADTVDLSATPPELTPAVAPNLVLTYDDSGSLAQGFVPGFLGEGEAIYGAYAGMITDPASGRRICGWFSADGSNLVHAWNFSPAVNTLYYDETQTYVAPSKLDGTAMDEGSITAAWEDGIGANTGGSRAARNLATNYQVTWSGGNFPKPDVILPAGTGNAPSVSCDPGVNGYMPFPYANADGTQAHAFFYRFTGPAHDIAALHDPTRYVAVDVTTLPMDQQRNFAIWYGFYRTRQLAARSALLRAFASVSGTLRVQWQRLNTAQLTTSALIKPLSDNAQRQAFAHFIYTSNAAGGHGAPTRSAIVRVAHYFGPSNNRLAENNPYYDTASGKELSCRRNYSLLVTDGGWKDEPGFTDAWKDIKDAQGTTVSVGANPDQTTTVLPDGRRYVPSSQVATIFGGGPSQNQRSGFADVAFHYWAIDLRPDLADNVVPYLPDRTTGVTGTSITAAIGSDPKTLPDEVYFNPTNDPATWQHLVQYVVAFGLDGQLTFPDDLPALRKGAKTWSDWASAPNDETIATPAKLDDTWHAAINSRGELFNASHPQQLADRLRRIIHGVVARNGAVTAGTLNASVLGADAVTFLTGFSSDDWSGSVQAHQVDAGGRIGTVQWLAEQRLDARTGDHEDRVILTSTATGPGHGTAFKGTTVVNAINAVDPGFGSARGDEDGLDRLAWIRGIRSKEGTVFRSRSSVLGAVINAQAAYVAYPASGYRDSFPSRRGTPSVPAPEMALDKDGKLLHSYEQFVADHLKRAPTLYVGANDGMVHAFDATTSGTRVAAVDVAPDPGTERWAYVPYSVYGGLRGMSALARFQYAPTVDGTPVTRDVFFGSGGKVGWHTILVAGLRLGGRGVYALDITEASASEGASSGKVMGPADKVLWEFNHMTPSAVGDPARLGYTFGRPNIGRLAHGKWAVLVPSGYFPADSTDPAASHPSSSLFVLDAQTGALIRELRTPETVAGVGPVKSHGLTTPVLGDYENDQVDDVAFAGDLLGNLWRFDLRDENPQNWRVDLLFRPVIAGDRPITVMPRLFPDPATGHFMVVFGTGKYLGSSDNLIDASTRTQAVYGIRDPGVAGARTVIEGSSRLVQQTLAEQAQIRGLTTHAVPPSDSAGRPIDGWYFLLYVADGDGRQTNRGERVVVDATALFDSNRAIITTLMPQQADPCNPETQGAVMVVDAATGGAAQGVNLGTVVDWKGAYSQAGARITDAPTGGSLPAAVRAGGGEIYFPGVSLASDGRTFSIGDALWRRRSWRVLNSDQ